MEQHMTPMQLQKLFEDTKSRLEYLLEIDKLNILGSPRKRNIKTFYHNWKVLKNSPTMAEEFRLISQFAEANKGKLTFLAEEESRGRIGWFQGIEVTCEYKGLKEEITGPEVQTVVKEALSNIWKVPQYNIDCKLLKLFMEGDITEEQLLKTIQEDCNV